ncbi:MAG: putative PEP-CTERM system histidine kinase [Halothiobacillaceae bacterium]|nr:MAG: putative PEP-CTERM system histidine kinase [Halothiobacillaceae bacterium]
MESVIKTAINKVADRRPVPIYEASTEPLHPVRVEKERLTVMLRHLLNNAQEATTPEGEVKITLASDGNFNIIRIEDNGIGMSGEFVRDRLFKPFDTTKGNAGMGIGMYESREFIRSIGGEIRVHSEEGLGTVVDVCIPVYRDDGHLGAPG